MTLLDQRNPVIEQLGGIPLIDRFVGDLKTGSEAAPLLPAEHRLLRLCINTLTAKTPAERSHARLESAREKCRAGNPFPLLAALDRMLLLRSEEEIAFFDANQFLPMFGHLPDYLLVPVLDPSNPPLRLDWWQKIILAAFFAQPIGEIFIKGCTGAGKGAIAGVGVCLWYDAHRESRTHITSRSFEHAHRNMFGEVAKWARRFRFDPQTLLGQTIGESQRHYIKILNPSATAATAGEAFSGAHGPNTLYVFDEASAIPDLFVSNAQKNARIIVALSNPRTLHGWFREAFRPLADREDAIGVCPGTLGMRLCVTVGGPDCMNVRRERLRRQVAPKGGIVIDGQSFDEGTPIPDIKQWMTKPLISDQIDLAQFRAICSKQDRREVDVFAYGKFPKEDPSKQVIMGSWLPRHFAAWRADAPPKVDCFGLDVARSLDGDCTCFAAGGKDGVRDLHLWQYNDTTYHVNRVIQIARERYSIDLTLGQHPVTVDMDGLGAGVGDQLRQRHVWVIEFRGNGKADVDPRKHANMRTEGYALLGRRLDPDDRWAATPWAMPEDSGLAAELCAPEKMYGNDFLRFGITPKRKPPGVGEGGRTVSVAEKLGRSPDKADAVVYLFCAVRLLHNMNEMFAKYEGPLVVAGPADGPVNVGEIVAARGSDGGATGSTAAGGSGAAPDGQRRKADELIEYLVAAYTGKAADAKPPSQQSVQPPVQSSPNSPPPVEPSTGLRWSELFPGESWED